MDSYTKESLRGFTDIIKNGTSASNDIFCEYDCVYPFTNECIRNYIDLIDFDRSSNALSVLASGDHVFNLVAKGMTDIDTFDINRLTEYYALGLKRAMIMKYSYQEFLEIVKIFDYQIGYGAEVSSNFFNKKIDIIKQLVLDLSRSMDYDYKTFWLKVIDYYNKHSQEKHLVNSLFATHCGYYVENNYYLSSKEAYNNLKNTLGRANISFNQSKIEDISSTFEGKKYDVILLSNILDYMLDSYGVKWNYSQFLNLDGSIESICNDDALIFYNYVFSWRYSSVSIDRIPVFFNSSVYLSDLGDMNLHEIKQSKSIEEGILLKKVKKNI